MKLINQLFQATTAIADALLGDAPYQAVAVPWHEAALRGAVEIASGPSFDPTENEDVWR